MQLTLCFDSHCTACCRACIDGGAYGLGNHIDDAQLKTDAPIINYRWDKDFLPCPFCILGTGDAIDG
jgi:hypothetical protein